MGRPTDYRPEFAAEAKPLAENGATNFDLARFFGVSITTIKSWRVRYPDFLAATKIAKEAADAAVERSLFERANGYSVESVKIFQYEGEIIEAPFIEHYPPDTTAAIFWLKNRRPDLWRDVQHREHGGNISNLSPAELEAEDRRLADMEASARDPAGVVDKTLPE